MSEGRPSVRRMMIDCDTCSVRGDACADCVVTFLTIPVREGVGPPEPGGGHRAGPAATAAPHELDDAERRAIEVLAGAGLVPPLRMVQAV